MRKKLKTTHLQLIDKINNTQAPIISKPEILITKEGKPIHLFGLQKNSITIKNDIISPIEEDWDINK